MWAINDVQPGSTLISVPMRDGLSHMAGLATMTSSHMMFGGEYAEINDGAKQVLD